MTSFEDAAIVFGALLVGGALVSGLARRSFLSLTALFVLTGLAVGQGGLGVLELDPRSGFVRDLAVVALIVILFRDGLEVEAEMPQTAWRLPLRKLVLAMPLTCVIVALAARVLTKLSWTECFLLGALLSPTDPVLSSSVVTNPRVPRLVRHSLNLESGMNDGLALPAVLAFTAALVGSGADGEPFAAYGVAVGVEGNGLIAVFVCAIALGIQRHDLRETFERRADDIVEIVKLGIFVVFGSLLTLDGLFSDGWAAVAVAAVTLLIARPAAIAVALIGTRLPFYLQAFMAWFGPKGVATMTFSLLVLADGFPGDERIFNLAALCVFVSILA